jgi:glucose/arabinose dehydrogenase
MAIVRLRFLLLSFLLPFAVACGGGGGGGGGGEAITGSLVLTGTGMPVGGVGSVAVSGPSNYMQSVDLVAVSAQFGFSPTPPKGTQTLANLAPGIYTVTAEVVMSQHTPYAPQPRSQSVAVAAGKAATAIIAYSVQADLSLTLTQVASGLSNPGFLSAPANDTRLFIVEKPGRIRIVKNGQLLTTPFLDIAALTSFVAGSERGLLSMVFHPQYASNGLFYVYYTDVNGNIAVYRFNVFASDADLADPASEMRILTIVRDPANSNNNGGLLAFGPDGFLYIATGDGGGVGDPAGNAQNLDKLLGKLLRIDVSNTTVAQPYTIPATNPFINQAGKQPEIWAYGLRNPWRYAFDSSSALLYIADVGQERRQEVNVAAASQGGLNYGWNIMEGSLCYPGDPCTQTGLRLPILEVGGNCPIIGGYAYRGSAIPELRGRYFYSDYCLGGLRSLLYRAALATEQTSWAVPDVLLITSFGEDAQKELYMLSSNGNVYRIEKQ